MLPYRPPQIDRPSLPPHCEPAGEFLTALSITFHTCIPSYLALISTLLGTCSIISWLFAQLPQIYKNYKLKSTSGLSVYFLTEWLLGDLTNLLGCLFTAGDVADCYCELLRLRRLWAHRAMDLVRAAAPRASVAPDLGPLEERREL
jgi:hypothetical protein